MRKLAAMKYFVIFVILACFFAGIWTLRNRHNAPALESDDPNQPFTVVNTADRSLDGVPALALTFSLPLDASKTVDQFVRVFEMPPTAEELKRRAENNEQDENSQQNPTSVSTKAAETNVEGGKLIAGAWVVGDNPRILYFPHINPQTRYIVQVQVGLPAKNGKTLASEVRYSILTAQISPAYYFASNGMVLPAKQNGGLPVVTVNVPEVDVQFLKVKNDQLPRFLDRVINGKKRATTDDDTSANIENNDYDWRRSSLHGAVQNYQLDDLRNLTDSVYEGRFVTEQTKNKRNVTYLPVENIKELKEPGIYVAVMSQPGRFMSDYQTTYFYISDIGLHTHLYDKSADVFVSSLANGKAVRDVEISWLDEQGKVLARANSDQDGHAVFVEQPKNAKVILAKNGQQISLLALKEPALDLSEFNVTGEHYKPIRLFAYSGRNLYRPGESIDLSVVARDADGNNVPPQPIQAKLKGPDGREQFNAMWRPDARFTGYFLQRVSLPADAATGTWTMELRADPADKIPATIVKFGVEEFLPERMKLELTSKQSTLKPDQHYTIDVVGTYLYGAPAAGNRLLGVVQFEPDTNPLRQQYPGFEFGDANENEKKTRKELEEQTLNDKGQASVAIDLSPVAERHSPYSVRTTLSLLESGGRPVVRSIEKVVWPAPILVGVRPLFSGVYAPENSPVEFEVIRSDNSGKLQASASMPVRLFREDRNYYWRFADQGGWQSGFTETDELVATSNVSTTANARGKLRLPVKYGRYRLEILDPATNQQLVYRFYAGWNAQENESQGNRPDRVALKLDKSSYKNGDTAQLTITPPHSGQALITVEGDRTLWVKRVPVSAGGSTVFIPIDEKWKRHDLYISAVVLRAGDEGDKVTPARALGIIYLPLNRSDKKLTVAIDAPAKVKPESSVKIKIAVPEIKMEQKAMVTLSAVDVGILNITQFATPDPFDFFFGRLRYGADIHDVYGRLIEKMAGRQGKLKFGGDKTPKPGKSLPKKVKLIDLFSGPVLLNAQGQAEIILNIPDFNGTLRLMAVVNAADHFGSKEQEMIVAAPLVAEIATPRFLSLGDSALISLDLTNLSGITQQYTLSLNGGDGLKIGDGERSLSLKDQQKTTLRFPLETRGALGIQNVNLKITSNNGDISRQFPLMVQAPTQQQQLKRRYTIKPNDTLEIKDADLSGLYPTSVLAHMLISNKAPIDIRAAVQGLLTYPYGCAEQTTSSAYPHLFIDETLAKKFGLKPFTREQRIVIIDQAMARLATMQAPNGGFSLWGNAADYEYWLSAYVTNFLVDAREQGFAVPDIMYNKAMNYLLRGLQEGVSRLPSPAQIKPEVDTIWRENRTRDNGRFDVLTFGGYVLSRTNKAPLSTLRQLHESRTLAASGLALTQLGIALKQMGDDDRSKIDLAAGLIKPRSLSYWWVDYGSTLRDAAMTYSLLQQHHIKLDGSENLLAIIADEMNKQRYYSTQEKLALFQVGRSYSLQTNEPWSASLTMNGKTENIGGNEAEFHELTTANLISGVKIKNNSQENNWIELALTGNPIKLLPPKNDIIKLSRTMYAPNGTAIGNRPLKVGETVMMHIQASANTVIGNGMIIDRIPAGLEIENANIVQGEQMNAVRFDGIDPTEAMTDNRIKHIEFRDDRFVAVARIENGTLNLFYRLRVVTPGKFVVPPLYADDMYRPDIYGSIGGDAMLTIVEAH